VSVPHDEFVAAFKRWAAAGVKVPMGPLLPPVMRTMPSFSSVAVAPDRAIVMSPVGSDRSSVPARSELKTSAVRMGTPLE